MCQCTSINEALHLSGSPFVACTIVFYGRRLRRAELILQCPSILSTVSVILSTVGRIIFEDEKFRGFRGYLVNLENKYPRNFLYIRLDFSFNTW